MKKLFLSLVLASPILGMSSTPTLSDYFTFKTIVHENDEKEKVEEANQIMMGTPLHRLLDVIKEEEGSHGTLEDVLATQTNLDNLRMGAQGCEILVGFLKHVVITPNRRFKKEYGKLPMTQMELLERIEKYGKRLARRAKEMEAYIAKNGNEKPRTQSSFSPWMIQSIINRPGMGHQMMWRPAPQLQKIPCR